MINIEEKRKKLKKQNIISASILIFGTLAAFLIFGPKNDEVPEEPEIPVALVSSFKLTAESARIAKLEKTATWDAGDKFAKAVSEFSGRIKTVSFEAGDKVYEGQVLAVFDQSKKENSPKVVLESAERSYDLTRENLSDTQDVANRSVEIAEKQVKSAKIQKEQVEEDAISTREEKNLAKQNVKIAEEQEKQAKESAEVQKNGAKIQLEQARVMLDQARVAYENTIVKSPITGMIVSKNISAQDFLNSGDVIAEIVGTGKLEAVVFLNQDEIGRVKTGDSAEIRINEKSYPGRISSASPIANNANERFEVKIVSDENLTKEANRTGSVILNVYLGADKGFFVPLDAVNIGQNKKEVFVIENGKADARTVELGKIIGTQIEVLKGLSDGDELIVGNSRNLTSGQAVRVK